MPGRHSCAITLVLAALGAPAIAQELTLTRVSWAESPDGAEISAFDPATSRLFTTGDTGISVFNFEHDGSLTLAMRIDLSGVFASTLGVSSIAIDPGERGFGLAAVIPTDNTARRGRAIAFSVHTGAVVASFETGFHPDMVCFTSDGAYALIADEGESTPEDDAPGGLTVIDLSSLSSLHDLHDARPMTFDFVRDLDPVVSLARIRPTFEGSGEFVLGLEPEYIAPDSDGAWIALQENNAVARFDFTTMRFTEVRSLGAIEQVIDASDRDGGALIDDRILTLPMPDSLGAAVIDEQRVPALCFGDPRVHALFAAIAIFRFQPRGVSNRDLRTHRLSDSAPPSRSAPRWLPNPTTRRSDDQTSPIVPRMPLLVTTPNAFSPGASAPPWARIATPRKLVVAGIASRYAGLAIGSGSRTFARGFV